eukprot:m.222852 g.222852  ORF g.222852 m.222852 type:complete len:124 (+) comp15134_c0_seq64:2455-2826(+)
MYHALINLLVGSCVHSLVTKQQNENILFVHVLCHECRQPPVSTDKCRTILVQALKDFEQEGARTTSVDAEWFARMAWNLAVETGRNDEYDLSGALFALSCKVSTSCFRQKAGASHGDTLNERF